MHDPHLTAQCTHPGKNTDDSGLVIGVLGPSGRQVWVANSRAITFHVTGDPSGIVECETPPADRRSPVVGDMRPLSIACFGKLPLITRCAKGDVHVKLLGVAYVPGVQFNLFSLRAVMPKCSVTLDAIGVHILSGSLSFVRRGTVSCIEATRVVEDPIAAAVLVPGKMHRMDINDLHVSLAHSHAETLRETAWQMQIKVVGELVLCAGCSEAKGRRTAVLWTIGCHSTKPLQRVFVDLSGKAAPAAWWRGIPNDDC